MSVDNCLNTAHQAGEISRDERDALKTLYDNLMKHYGNADQAKAEMVARLIAQAEHQKRQKLIADAKRLQIEQFILTYKNRRGEADPVKAALALIEHQGQVRMPDGVSSMVGRSKAIGGLAMAQIEDTLNEFRRSWVAGTTRNTARLENVAREAGGQSTGDAAAKQMAKALLGVFEELRLRANAAGMAIGKLDGWIGPQVHDKLAMMRAGKVQWKKDILDGLDPAKIKHALTGKPLTQTDIDQALDYIYDNVTTDGWLSREATGQIQGLGALSNQRSEHRFLHFKSPDAWLAYNAKYGGGMDYFQASLLHIRGMAEDIAAMETLGPNPRATLTYLQNFIMKQAALRKGQKAAVFPTKSDVMGRSFERQGSWFSTVDPEDYARKGVKLLDDMWDMYRGADDAVVNQRVADVFGTIRNINVAGKLGGATLSAVTDLGFQQMARRFAGLPVTKTYSDVLKAFSKGSRRDAERAALITDNVLSALHADARWAGGIQGPMWTRYLADRTIAFSGLAAWTNNGQRAFRMSFMAELGRLSNRDFSKLPAAMQKTFQRYGLTAADWDAIRAQSAAIPGGAHFLRATDVDAAMKAAGRGEERIAERYLEMLLQETEYAVPTGTLQAKATAYGGLKRGVVTDELWRSAAQFKMFGISVALLQGQRIASEMAERGVLRGAGYAATVLIVTSLYGALAMQLKELSKGRDPRDMTDPETALKFWGGAMLQGGGLGIYGDFLASEQSRTGGGLAETLAGPTVGAAAGVLSMTSGSAARALRGEDTNVGREAVRFIGGHTPGGTLWYLRAAYERVVLDELSRMLDPKAYQSFSNRVRRQSKDYGNEFYWRPGESAPDRGPNLGAAFGQQ